MFNFMEQAFTSDDEALSFFADVQSREHNDLLKAIKNTNGSDADQSIAQSIFGAYRPVADANCANRTLLRYAAMRTRSALKAVAVAYPDAEFEIIRWGPDLIGIPTAQRLHLPMIRRKATSLAKQRYTSALTRLIPVAQASEFVFCAVSFGLKEAGSVPYVRPRVQSGAASKEASAIPVQHNPISLACAALELWSSSSPDDADMLLDEAASAKSQRRKFHIDRFVLDALTRPTSSFFGFGVLRMIARSVLDEVAARAKSLDLGGSSPIQPAGINAFLAGLNVDKVGTRVVLPPITNK